MKVKKVVEEVANGLETGATKKCSGRSAVVATEAEAEGIAVGNAACDDAGAVGERPGAGIEADADAGFDLGGADEADAESARINQIDAGEADGTVVVIERGHGRPGLSDAS